MKPIAFRSFLISIQALLLLSVLSCKKNKDEDCGTQAVLRNLMGQNDCNWILDVNGEYLEPKNLNDFGLQLFDGQKYKISYQIDNSGLPVCQTSNTMIILNCIEEQ